MKILGGRSPLMNHVVPGHPAAFKHIPDKPDAPTAQAFGRKPRQVAELCHSDEGVSGLRGKFLPTRPESGSWATGWSLLSAGAQTQPVMGA